jgi:hypothetical protein
VVLVNTDENVEMPADPEMRKLTEFEARRRVEELNERVKDDG